MQTADLSSHRIEGFTRADLGGVPFSMPLHSEIEPGLWQGGDPGTWGPTVLPAGVTRVLNLYGSTYQVPADVDWYTHPLFDSGDQELDAATLETLASLVNDARDDGHTVLVHCQAGLNRSGLVSALSLMRRHGISADEVITRLRETRSPAVLCNAHFERWLREDA